MEPTHPALQAAYDIAKGARQSGRPLDATRSTENLRRGFCLPCPETGLPSEQVVEELAAAAIPGLVGNTDPGFFAWVMGGSNLTGVAADWLTSVWGQNAAIFQTSPAAAIAEEAVAGWLLELLDLPRQSSVGFVTGATMAGFVGLAAARGEVLRRVGCDIEKDGLQSAPHIHVFISEDSHVSNFSALRYLGFGERNFHRIKTDQQGMMLPADLAVQMTALKGPKIVIGTAGHINSGGFDDFQAISALCREQDAWLHVDGAFGLWARLLPEKDRLTTGIELADSWSVDGHKWLQIPYDSGFAIVRDPAAHSRAMDMTASYLNQSPEDGRNPSSWNPELSRRARGFAAWAVIRSLGRHGITEIIREHCKCAEALASELAAAEGVAVWNRPDLNQLILRVRDCDQQTQSLADELNRDGASFVRTTTWKGKKVLRISIIEQNTNEDRIRLLSRNIQTISSN